MFSGVNGTKVKISKWFTSIEGTKRPITHFPVSVNGVMYTIVLEEGAAIDITFINECSKGDKGETTLDPADEGYLSRVIVAGKEYGFYKMQPAAGTSVVTESIKKGGQFQVDVRSIIDTGTPTRLNGTEILSQGGKNEARIITLKADGAVSIVIRLAGKFNAGGIAIGSQAIDINGAAVLISLPPEGGQRA